METEVQCSYVADVTGALEKLRQGNADERRRRNRNIREAEDGRTRSLSPGLCRSYDWNTTHFYPDIHQENKQNLFISTYRGMGRTVRFASDRESDEEKEEENDEELEKEEEDESRRKEEWRRGKRKVEEGDCKDESKKYLSSSDDFEEENSSSDSDRNAIRGSELKVKAIPIVHVDVKGRRIGSGLSLSGGGQPGPPAAVANHGGVGQNGRDDMDRSRIQFEPQPIVLDQDNTIDDWKNNVDDDDSEWRWEKVGMDHQRTNTLCENEDNDWNQMEFIDEEPHPSIPSKKSATQLCNNAKSNRQAFKSKQSDDSDELQKRTKTASTRGLVREEVRKDNSLSQTRGRHQNPKPRQKGQCMVTHFDDICPVSEFGSDYIERRKELPTFHSDDAPIPTKEQPSREAKSLRSILKQNKVADVPTSNSIADPFGGSDLPTKEPSLSSTLPNLHRFVGSTASRSASVVDDRDEAENRETWKETGYNGTDAQEKQWKSESFLFLEDARSKRNGKRKRFVIDYRRPSAGHVAFTGTGERRTIGPFTLNEFELCLDIPDGQRNGKEVSPEMKNEEDRSQKMKEIRMELPVNRCGIGETFTGKDDLSARKDPSSDLFWLFHRVSKSDCPSWKGSRNHSTEVQPQNRLLTADAPFHATDLDNSVNNTKETSTYPDPDVKWKTGEVMRQQYRWSTAIREPHARILLDQWNVEPPLNLIPPPRNRYRIVRPGQDFLKKYHTTDRVDSERSNESASQNERAFTIAGQPKSSSSLKTHSTARQDTTKFALVGISHQDRSTIPQLGLSTEWQNERNSTRLEDAPEPGVFDHKHRYLRERVLTEESSVDFNPELIDPAPVDPILSSPASAYHSLQKLEQLRLASGAKNTPIYHETWDSNSSKSLLNLPSNLPRQRNVDMTSVGSQDSVGKTSDARTPKGQRILGRRGNACAVVSPMRQPPPSQNLDASGEESTSDRSMSTLEMLNTEEIRGLTQFATSNDAEKTPVAEYHRPTNFRKNKKIHQTPRTVKARHEMKARRVKGSD